MKKKAVKDFSFKNVIQMMILQHQHNVEQHHYIPKKADYFFQYVVYHMTASRGKVGHGRSFFTLPSSVSHTSSNNGIEGKAHLKVEVKQEPNSAGIWNKFPIELDSSNEEDYFESKKIVHDNVGDGNDDNDDKDCKNVDTYPILANIGKHIEVDVVCGDNEECEVSDNKEA